MPLSKTWLLPQCPERDLIFYVFQPFFQRDFDRFVQPSQVFDVARNLVRHFAAQYDLTVALHDILIIPF